MSGGLRIRAEPAGPDGLLEYGRIPIAFLVTSRVRVAPDDEVAGGFRLTEETLPEPFPKDYDALGDRPALWSDRYDLTNWAVIGARADGELVGGAVMACDTDGCDMLEGRRDLAVLWDIRVHPAHRRTGVGTGIFDACVAWSRARDCRELKVETQDVNVAACRFYASRGCVLSEVVPGAYAACPDETMLIWRRPLA